MLFRSIATTNLICGKEIVILKKNQWSALCNEESVYENQFEGGAKIAEMYILIYNMLYNSYIDFDRSVNLHLIFEQ